ncbi:MAG: thiol:disulfide interchange protein DsbA/DsbL [Gallionella sp.]|nr:thiol:disulfide interchange protein DsbA/DsbL [Gallionella sp.]
MKNLMHRLLLATTLLFSTTAFADSQLGKDYVLMSPSQPTSNQKIEVLEFFFYQCSHCFHLHPFLMEWEKTMPKYVELHYVPTMFNASTEPLARTFYALEGLGQLKQVDDAIYQAIHVQQAELFDLNSISPLVVRNGVDKDKFAAAFNSFTVNSKVNQAKQMIRTYKIQGTPTLVVAGKYVITQQQPQDVPRILNDVIAKVRQERGMTTRPVAAPAKKHTH